MENKQVIFFIIWVICGLFASSVASNKGHNGCMWCIGGFLFGPLAVLATLGLGDRISQRKQDELLEETREQNAWMREKMRQKEREIRYMEEERYYEEEKYNRQMRQLPPEEYYEDDNNDEYDTEYINDYDEKEINITNELDENYDEEQPKGRK